MKDDLQEIIDFIRQTFKAKNDQIIPLHEPRFAGNEKKYVLDAIDSTFVSSVGEYVERFEQAIARYTGARYAVATVNGTAALHLALIVAGVAPDTEVITQPLSFVATANAITYTGASPVFLDINPETLSLDPQKLHDFLKNKTIKQYQNGRTVVINKNTGRAISACVPVHVFGLPAYIAQITEICQAWEIPVIEDAAESLGSFYKNRHTGTFGKLGVFSFNGNKIITCGGGGMIVTNDKQLAQLAKHLSTQAKIPHPYEYIHDRIGYNYRLTNLQAALGLAQMENLERFVEAKRQLAMKYKNKLAGYDFLKFVEETPQARSNYWLPAVVFKDFQTRELFIKLARKNKVLVRPAWQLLNTLNIYAQAPAYDLDTAQKLAGKIVNLPGSVIL